MKPTLTFFLLILFYAGVFAQDHTLTVTIIESEKGTGMTVIQYEFRGEDDVYDISAEVSFDNGGHYQFIPASHIEGALENVAPGGPYTLLWDGGQVFLTHFPMKQSSE